MYLKKTKKVVIINAGHHDHDPGKVVTYATFQEADEAMLIRDELIPLLELAGVTPHFVPDNLTLSQSIAWADLVAPNLNDGIAVDIHLNANSNSDVSGVEAYHGSSQISKNIAKVMSSEIASSLGIRDRGPKDQSLSYVGSLAWINQVNVRSVLVETCYMTNKSDWLTLQTEGGHRKAAIGIANGICNLLGIPQPEWDIETPAPEEPETTHLFVMFINLLKSMFNLFRGADPTAVKEQVEDELLTKQNVVGVGVGLKNGEGKDGIVVLVSVKDTISALSAEDVIPRKIRGVRTDVIVVGDVTSMGMAVHGDRHRPVKGGTSAVWHKGTACTLGAIVFKDGDAYALQNTHCAFPHWKGAKLGDNIIQPSVLDGGDKRKDVIGQCTEGEMLHLDGATANRFDTALVKLTVPYQALTQNKLGDIIPTPAVAKTGDTVIKSGRTTGTQTSKVVATGVTISVGYGIDKTTGERLTGKFVNQVLVANDGSYFTAGGDSSSLVVNTKRQPVGQIFAGSDRIAIFSPIAPIMEHFGFSFEDTPAQSEPTEGYMALGRVDGLQFATIDNPSFQPGNTAVLDTNVNFRQDPSLANSPISVLYQGDTVTITDHVVSNDGFIWAKVRQHKK